MNLLEDPEFYKWLASLGVGGLLGAFMFMFYRKDVKQYTELWKMATDQFMSIVKENTASNAKLISLIENQERNTLRKSDIEALIERTKETRVRESRDR